MDVGATVPKPHLGCHFSTESGLGASVPCVLFRQQWSPSSLYKDVPFAELPSQFSQHSLHPECSRPHSPKGDTQLQTADPGLPLLCHLLIQPSSPEKCLQSTKSFTLSFDHPHDTVLHHTSNSKHVLKHHLLRPTSPWPIRNITFS